MRVFLAALLFLGLSACSAQDVLDRTVGFTSGTGLVHGRVVWVGGAVGPAGGLGSARIYFYPRHGHAFTAVTDSRGGYSVRLPAGSYTVGFAAFRLLPQAGRQLTVQRGDLITLDLPVPSPVVFG